jgi:RNA polymerase sigma-70 factor (ECF subfamily)
MNIDDEISDEDLMLAYAAGDASAFARLYDRHERATYRYFLRQAVAPSQADDLLQETWMAIVRHAPRYAPDARFTTWLYTIARSKLVDHWRATRRQVAVIDEAVNDPDDAGDHDAITTVLDRVSAGESARPDVQAMSRQYARAFIAAVEALPEAQREVFLLHVDGELSLDAMAAITSVGIETAKSRLRYAMKRLRIACAEWLQPSATRIEVASDEA